MPEPINARKILECEKQKSLSVVLGFGPTDQRIRLQRLLAAWGAVRMTIQD
jgi:hypothetical protein